MRPSRAGVYAAPGTVVNAGIIAAVRGVVIVLVVIALLVVGLLVWAVGVNNQLVTLDQNVNEKWAQVQKDRKSVV